MLKNVLNELRATERVDQYCRMAYEYNGYRLYVIYNKDTRWNAEVIKVDTNDLASIGINYRTANKALQNGIEDLILYAERKQC